jgi:hypothetical protein
VTPIGRLVALTPFDVLGHAHYLGREYFLNTQGWEPRARTTVTGIDSDPAVHGGVAGKVFYVPSIVTSNETP